MRLAIVSDTHTSESFNKIYNHLKIVVPRYQLDGIVVNGDLLGLHKVKNGYRRFLKEDKINLTELLKSHAPFTHSEIIKTFKVVQDGKELDEEGLEKFSELLKDFIDERYMWVLNSLRKLSTLTKVYYNIGNYESPLHYKVKEELAFILNIDISMINKILDQTARRDHFSYFKDKLKSMEKESNFVFISQQIIEDNGVLISGIPGLYNYTDKEDEYSTAQEKLTSNLINEIKEKMSLAHTLLLFNHVDGNTTRKPFVFKPASSSVIEFLSQTQFNDKVKLFCESNESFVTTHFYRNKGWYMMLNNAGVNNGIYNIIDVSNEIKSYDVDPNFDQIIGLMTYDLEQSNYNEPIQRMKLNYPESLKIINQRNLDNSIDNL